MSTSIDIAAVEARFSRLAPQMMDEAAHQFSAMYDITPKLPPTAAAGAEWLARMTSNASAGTFSPDGPLPAPGSTSKVQAAIPFANYGGTISINHKATLEQSLAESNGTAQIMGLLFDELEQLRMSQASKIDTDTITNANTTNAVVGVHGTNSAINDTGTYAGLSRATYANWACNIYDNSSTPRALTVALLNASWGHFNNVIGREPGQWVILTDYLQANAMAEMVTGASVSEKAVTGTTAEQILGRTMTWYAGLPVITIPGWTAGRVDFVNITATGYEQLAGGFTTIPMENTGTQFLFKLVNYLAYRIKNPRHNAFAITDLS